MKRVVAWTAFLLGSLIFILPLVGMTEFSLSMRRGVYSFDAYASVLADPQFRATFTYSVIMALFTIIFGVLLVVPTAYWVRLKMPGLRPVVEFITLMPLVRTLRAAQWLARHSRGMLPLFLLISPLYLLAAIFWSYGFLGQALALEPGD